MWIKEIIEFEETLFNNAKEYKEISALFYLGILKDSQIIEFLNNLQQKGISSENISRCLLEKKKLSKLFPAVLFDLGCFYSDNSYFLEIISLLTLFLVRDDKIEIEKALSFIEYLRTRLKHLCSSVKETLDIKKLSYYVSEYNSRGREGEANPDTSIYNNLSSKSAKIKFYDDIQGEINNILRNHNSKLKR